MSKQKSSRDIGIGDVPASLGRNTDRPVVGVVATPENADYVAGTILRGVEEGYDTIVCHGGESELDAIRFANELGAQVVEVDLPHECGPGFSEALSQTARERGYPGVFFQSDVSKQIDFETSLTKTRDDEAYLTEAVPAPELQTDSQVLVGIPAYNEAGSIAEVVRESLTYADEVVVVDDGSTDETVRLAAEAGAMVIEHETNKGYGGALKTLFTEAARCHADHLVILDGDGQHDPDDIPNLLAAQREHDAEVVIGSRYASGARTDMPHYRRFGVGVVNVLTNLSLGVVRRRSWVSDTQSGFRVYNKDAIESLSREALGTNMSASTDILHHAHKQGYSIHEVGARVSYDVEESSSHHPIKHGIQLVSNLVRTIERERPLSTIGVLGFTTTALGVMFVYWTFANFLASGTFPIGLAIVSGMFGLFGAFSSFTAIILHSLNTHAE